MPDELIVQTTEADKKVAANFTDYTAEHVAIIQKTVAKNATGMELAFFLSVCHSVGLNPFLKEAWCYKDNKKNLLVFAGRDGFLKKAQQHPHFAGIRSCEIRENDEFEIDVANNKIKHTVKHFGADRGKILGAYAIAFRKDGEPTIELADFDRYNRGWNVWKTHPEAMIKKVAETNALKKAFGISGVMSEYDFDVKNDVAIPISSKIKISLLDEIHHEREKIESDLTDKNFLKAVMESENIPAAATMTQGQEAYLRNVILIQQKYDLATAKRKEKAE